MKLQVAIFVTTRKPEIRGRAKIANSGQYRPHCAGQDAVARDGPGNAARRVEVRGREGAEGSAGRPLRPRREVPWTEVRRCRVGDPRLLRRKGHPPEADAAQDGWRVAAST